MKLESHDSVEEKRRWKIVRTDSFADVPGEIITASEETGACSLQVTSGGGTEVKELCFGPHGIRIIGRRR